MEMRKRFVFALWGCNLHSNFHAVHEAGRWFRHNISDTMADVEWYKVKVRVVTAVRKIGVTEIRAYFPAGHRPAFSSNVFCNFCEKKTSDCDCVKRVMEG